MSDAPPPPKYRQELANFVALNGDLAEKREVWKSKPYYLEYATNSACRSPIAGRRNSNIHWRQ